MKNKVKKQQPEKMDNNESKEILSKEKEETSKIKNEEVSKDNDIEEFTTDEEKIEDLSKIVELPIEKVNQILQYLNLNIDDLSNKENLISFLQEAFNKSESVQLLDIPNIKDIMRQVSDILKGLPSAEQNINTKDINEIQKYENTETKTDTNKKLKTNEESSTKDFEQIKMQTTTNTVVEKPVSDKNTNEEEIVNTNEEEKTISTKQVEVKIVETSDNTKNNFTGKDNTKEDDINFIDKDNNNNISLNNEVKFEKIIQTKTQITQTTKAMDTQNVIDQIIENLKVDVRGNESSVRMTLHPESLGDVSLKITTQNGVVTAQFVAENEKVKEILKSNFNDLKNVLQEQGINISSLSVSVRQENKNSQMNDFSRQQGNSPKRINNIISATNISEKENIEIDVYNDYYNKLDTSVNYTA